MWPLVTSGGLIIDMTSKWRAYWRFFYSRAFEWCLVTFCISSRSWVTLWFCRSVLEGQNRLAGVWRWRHNSMTWPDHILIFGQKTSNWSLYRCAKFRVQRLNRLGNIREKPRGVHLDPPGGEGLTVSIKCWNLHPSLTFRALVKIKKWFVFFCNTNICSPVFILELIFQSL